MAAKKNLEVVPSLPTQSNETLDDRPTQSIETDENRTLEEVVADELLHSINWNAVNAALLKGVKQKFLEWFTRGKPASMIATNEIEAEALAIESAEEAA
ncbi:hypothetical protein [Pseudanabaena sp. 'Roaring Creek']|uniref:hypothetical protein n=1 Tax=Pseudanabaena sp. 'Roaring Creek' TaxID=1681830 RepID=UPI0006D7C222|nr:hypothetical protein [Pseudanabaena sp. 'Roaring Creek']